MGVISVPTNEYGFTFNGQSSKDYGVYITDLNVFDGAARDVELVEIPGRNGAYVIDNGRFNEVTIRYHCAMGAGGETGAEDFAANMAAVRSWLSSAKGYARLEDDINPDEYRMALFAGGLEVGTNGTRTGEFSVEFTARPERWLKAGETAVEITSGGTIDNPTLFDAAPLLQVWGYGNIGLNNDTIAINDEPIGRLEETLTGENSNAFRQAAKILQAATANTGDPITVSGAYIQFNGTSQINPGPGVMGVVATQTSGDVALTFTTQVTGSYSWRVHADFADMRFVKGTAATLTMEFDMQVRYSSSPGVANGTATITYAYDGDSTLSGNYAVTVNYNSVGAYMIMPGRVSVISSKPSLGEPLYFDLDLGEAYKYEDDTVVSVNNAVSFPANLPTLKPGDNEITYDSTVTQLKVVPRWWKV